MLHCPTGNFYEEKNGIWKRTLKVKKKHKLRWRSDISEKRRKQTIFEGYINLLRVWIHNNN